MRLKPCGNGEHNLETHIVDKGIVIFTYGKALGYFDINYCPLCGERLRQEVIAFEEAD
jgi:NAD-dependent SIR2 family protein deacetylase